MNSGEFAAQTSVGRRRDTDADTHQADALTVRQQAAVLLRCWKEALVRPQQEEIIRVTPALGHQGANGHTIQLRRDASDIVLA